ncbi:MAG: oxidoreductase [Clostridiales bacterium]|nr:oxidoreductase [Lachnospiraceae bacterium]MCD7921730.1 oxidoreductase [Clostridiales bacterium]MCD8109629.1 oxidoreductase [Clostridiales bacterium]MCD8134357.1 oxidoreductase [Clostridiales bacterium]
MKQWYLVHDIRWCHDCNNCLMSCKDEHVGNEWPGYTESQPRHGHRWVNVMRRERGRYARNDYVYLSMPCQHCEKCPLVAAGYATRRDDGIVLIDMDKARGHKEVASMCPYGAVYYNDEKDVAQKCTMCAHLLDDPDWKPGVPRCVHSCPTKTFQAYHLDPLEMQAMIETEKLEVYRPELGLNPHVYYKNLYKFTKNFVAGGILVNRDCYENATIELRKDGVLVDSQKTNFFGDFKFDGLDDGKYVISIDAAGNKKDIDVEIAGESLNLDYIEF